MMTRSPLEDLPDHVQLKIYELVPPGCRPSAEQAVPCFQEIARQRAQQRARQLGPAAPSGEVSERERVAVDRERETSPKSKPSAKKPAAPLTSVQQSAIDAAQSAAAAAEKARLDAGGGGEPTAGPKVRGVDWEKKKERWRARLAVDGRTLLLCTSESKAVCEAAVAAAREAVSKPSAKEPAAPLTSVQQSSKPSAKKPAAPLTTRSSLSLLTGQ